MTVEAVGFYKYMAAVAHLDTLRLIIIKVHMFLYIFSNFSRIGFFKAEMFVLKIWLVNMEF